MNVCYRICQEGSISSNTFLMTYVYYDISDKPEWTAFHNQKLMSPIIYKWLF